MPIDLFIGLVTHPKTRFVESSGPQGLVRQLESRLSALGISVQVSICDQNLYDPTAIPITEDVIRESIQAELSLEKQWRKYLHPAKKQRLISVEMWLRQIKRERQFLKNLPVLVGSTDELSKRNPGIQMVTRLINIELAHVSLMDEAAAADATWILIVEDDAIAEDIEQFVASLKEFMQDHEHTEQPNYVNISHSFNESTLGIQKLLTPVQQFGNATIYKSSRPVTNTVCAILYRGSFLKSLLNVIHTIPVEPVVPIDWKLNLALLKMWDSSSIRNGDCWVVTPGPIIQSSMIDADA